jgi:hypothetical protein
LSCLLALSSLRARRVFEQVFHIEEILVENFVTPFLGGPFLAPEEVLIAISKVDKLPKSR